MTDGEPIKMVDTLAALTAAPLSFDFEGKTYSVSPLTIQDLGALRLFTKRYISEQAAENAEMMAAAGAPQEHLAALWAEMRAALKNPLVDEWLGDVPVFREFMRLSLRRKHPDITSDELGRMLDDQAVYTMFLTWGTELNATQDEVKNA